jgi:hypothetical protein
LARPEGRAAGSAPIVVARASIACLASTDDSVVFLQLRLPHAWAAGGTLRRVAKGGGPPAVFATVPTPSFGCVGADPERVYVATADEHSATGDGAIRSFPKKGGSARTIAKVTTFPLWLKTSGDDVYWIEADSLMSAPKAGGRASKVVTAAGSCRGIRDYVVDDTNVYFSCGDAVWRASKHGSAPAELVAGGQRGAQGLTVDAEAVYWLNGDPSFRGKNEGALVRLAKGPRWP